MYINPDSYTDTANRIFFLLDKSGDIGTLSPNAFKNSIRKFAADYKVLTFFLNIDSWLSVYLIDN